MLMKTVRGSTGSVPKSLLVATAFALQIVCGVMLTWGAWSDVLIDFGRELYVPQQLSDGAVLYRDIAYFNGPFSPYFNALCFQIFGASMQTLVIVNSTILLIFSILMYDLLQSLTKPLTALISVSSFIWLVAFTQYVHVGNYNWITPYSHEMTHGLCLSAGAIWFAKRFLLKQRLQDAVLCGSLCGLVFLTKCEIAIALYPAIITLFAIDWYLRRGDSSISVLSIEAGAVGFILPPLISILWLTQFSLEGPVIFPVLGSWTQLVKSDLTASPYYAAVMGTANLSKSLNLMYGWGVLYGIVLGFAAFCAKQSSLTNRKCKQISVVLFGAMLCLFWIIGNSISWLEMARPWPLILLAIYGLEAYKIHELRKKDVSAQHLTTNRFQHALKLSLLTWSGLLLLKIAFYARLSHYGFALSVPALIILVAASWEWWPKWIETRGGQKLIARAGLLSLIVAGGVAHLSRSSEMMQMKNVRVEANNELFLSEKRGEIVNVILDEIENRVAVNETILCLPEGISLNYMSRRRNSSKYLNFVPADIMMFGEEKMLVDLQTHPPDWIILINRDTSEYGLSKFTVDYAQGIGAWIDQNYEVSTQIGGEYMTWEPGFSFLRRVNKQEQQLASETSSIKTSSFVGL